MTRILAVMALVAVTAQPALAAGPATLEACFLGRINSARTAEGAPALVRSAPLDGYGRDHSRAMAAAGDLFHSTPSQVAPFLPSGWRSWGENVGFATGSEDCDFLFQGFWNSPRHRANLMDPGFDTVGIGVFVDAADTMWTTHVFVDTAGTPPPTTTSPTTSTTTGATTTTAASSTTTAPTTTQPPSTTTAPTTTTAAASTPAAPTPPGPVAAPAPSTLQPTTVGSAPATTTTGDPTTTTSVKGEENPRPGPDGPASAPPAERFQRAEQCGQACGGAALAIWAVVGAAALLVAFRLRR